MISASIVYRWRDGNENKLPLLVLRHPYHSQTYKCTSTFLSTYNTLIWTEITCESITCYMCNLACMWPIVKNDKILWSYVKFLESSRMWEILESWLAYANNFSWITQSCILTGAISEASTSLFFLFLRILNFRILKKLINLFCLHCSPNKSLKMKLGESKIDKKNICQIKKSWKPQKIIITVWNISN